MQAGAIKDGDAIGKSFMLITINEPGTN